MIRRALAGWLLAAACGSSSDGRPDEELGGLVVSPSTAPASIRIDRAVGDPAELGRAVALTHQHVGALIGPHTVTGRAHLEVHENGRAVEVLDEESAIELDARGHYHAVHNNSKDYGREAYFVDGWMYLRPRYGKHHKRRPTDQAEPNRVRNEIYGTLAAHIELLLAGAALSDGGAAQVAGRPARLVVLATAPGQGRRPPPQTHSQRKWRETAVVREVSGEIALDQKTGVPLRARVEGSVAYSRDGRSFVMDLAARHELGALDAVEEVAAPAAGEVISDIEQRHELDERDQLLEGIAPPAARSRSPANPTGRE